MSLFDIYYIKIIIILHYWKKLAYLGNHSFTQYKKKLTEEIRFVYLNIAIISACCAENKDIHLKEHP